MKPDPTGSCTAHDDGDDPVSEEMLMKRIPREHPGIFFVCLS